MKIFNQLLCILYGGISIDRYALFQEFAKYFEIKDDFNIVILCDYNVFIHIMSGGFPLIQSGCCVLATKLIIFRFQKNLLLTRNQYISL